MQSIDFIEDFKEYTDCIPPGVRLPRITIDPSQYKALGIPNTSSNYDFLRHLCLKGVKDKGIDKDDQKTKYYERVKSELDTLRDLGFVDYILLNWDVLDFCHSNGIPTGPGRGSAAGSLVLYLIGVTQIDPIKHDLFFERFVSQSRARKIEDAGVTYLDGSLLADVDNDICYAHRHKVTEYIDKKYPGRTAKILTLNTLSSKLCIRECGKIVGSLSEAAVNVVTALIPKTFGKVASISKSIDQSEKFKEWATDNSRVIEISKKIEGLNKNSGVHPSGIAISYASISSLCPLQLTNDGALVTAYDMNWVSELMVKFDILGLRTLTVIYDTCRRLKIDPIDIDLSSPDLYAPLSNLECAHGLFQIEAHTDLKVCRSVKPKDLEELSAVMAIARPGALDFMEAYSTYCATNTSQSVHTFFDEVLGYTGGIPLYQEQLMKMAVAIGFTLDEAEQLRRIVGKKKVDDIPIWKEKIEEKIEEQGLDPEIGEVLWSVAEDSANYSFNKSHSISYATLAAWTTYLKFSFPQDFFLSLLRMTQFEPSPQTEVSKISQELPHFDIRLLPPNLIKSKMDFSLEGPNIRYGLSSIKGISQKSLSALRRFRNEDNSNKFDLFLAAKDAGLNIGVLSALIQAGALSDASSENRCKLVLEAQSFNILTEREKRNFIAFTSQEDCSLFQAIKLIKGSDFSLIGDDGKPLMKESRYNTFKKKYEGYKQIYLKNAQWPSFANWYFEKQLLGFSYSQELSKIFHHPTHPPHNSLHFKSLDPRQSAKYIFSVSEYSKEVSRNGNSYMRLSLEDEFGTVSAILCDRANDKKCTNYLDIHKAPKEGNIVTITGTKSGDGDSIFVDNLNVVDDRIFMKLRDVSS